MTRHEVNVSEDQSGTRVDVVVAAIAGSRTRAQRWIAEGQVKIGGSPVAKRHVLSAGETVVIEEPEAAAPPDAVSAAAAVPVVYEDADLLVVDKPAGLVVHPAPGHRTGTLVQLLEGRVAGGADGWRAGLVHRLDRDTSGLLVLAKHEAAHAALKRQIEEREIVRRYLALVEGRPRARSGTIDAPIGRDRRLRTRHSTDTDRPRSARTHFEIAELLPRTTLLDVSLETGRTHQIRVHLEAIGHPVCGDPVYGTAGMLGLERQFLHAAWLELTHPGTGERLKLKSVLPDDLGEALELARDDHPVG
jgi:23S rRNA pseudouridine1911/1915/1917 synthase